MPEPAVFQRILLAVGDGSCADQLVTGVAGLASTGDAEVLLVYVSDCNVCAAPWTTPLSTNTSTSCLGADLLDDSACSVLVLPRQPSAVAGRETSRWWRSTRWPGG